MKNPYPLFKLLVFIPLLLCAKMTSGQISLSTASTFANNNGSGTVTFNFENTNTSDILITEIEGIVGTAVNASVDFCSGHDDGIGVYSGVGV